MQWGCSPGNEARPGRLGADDFEDEIRVYLLVTDGYDLDFVDPHNWTAFQGHMVSLCNLKVWHFNQEDSRNTLLNGFDRAYHNKY